VSTPGAPPPEETQQVASGSLPQVPGVRMVAEIGRGGFATVYRAHQISVDRDVAVKVDDRRLVDTRDRRRFTREISAAGAVSDHPHIVSLYDGGTTADDHPYLVMELYSGGSYAEKVRTTGPIPPTEVMDTGFAIADALVAAHGEGILHRDVKPGNILISRYGSPALTDFGLAALPPAGEGYSVTMDSLTPSYAAPEAFGGAEPTVGMDVYALGATLYALLLGRPPRSDPSGASPPLTKLLMLLNEPLPPAGVPGAEDLMPVIWRATAPDPADRYPTAAALRDALAAVRAGRPQAAGGLHPSVGPAVAPGAGGGLSGHSGSRSQVLPEPSERSVGATGAFVPPRPAAARRRPVLVGAAVLVVLIVGAAVWLGTGSSRVSGSATAALNAPLSATSGSSTTGRPPSGSPGSSVLPPVVSTPTTPPVSSPTAPSTAPSSPTSASTPTSVSLDRTPPPVGTCWGGVTTIGTTSTSTQVSSCAVPHSWEAYATGVLDPKTPSPQLNDIAEDQNVLKTCNQPALQAYLGLGHAGTYSTRVLPPTDVQFVTGHRGFWCLASKEGAGVVTGSLRDG
jgi:serine/threonine protein kinase